MLELLMGYITVDVPEDNGDELGIGLTVNNRAVMSSSSSCSPSLGKPTPDFVSVFLSNSEALKTCIFCDFVWRMYFKNNYYLYV